MAVDMFIKIDDIKGESTDEKHKDLIEVISWSWGMTQSGSSHIGTGSGTGKVDVSNLTITKFIDTSSPALIKMCCKGKAFSLATLYVRKAGDKPVEYVKLELYNGLISQVAVAGSNGDDKFTENVSLNFAAFKYYYTPQVKGAAGAEIPAAWNIAKNSRPFREFAPNVMPELTHKERLQPSLLDRLTDDEPDEREESREKRALSQERLRACVLRDLTWLFNTTNLSALVDLGAYPEIARSVLNYGLPDLAGHTVTGMDIPELEQLLKRAIWNYEPRLIQRSVQVRLAVDADAMSHNSMSFAIEAELFAQPLPQQLYLRTEIDLEDGDVRVAMREQPLPDRPPKG